ncbi:MAG: hypothetical protein QW836_10005 [Ignisphaera sp.]
MLRKSFCEQFIKVYSTPIRVAIALNLINKYSFSRLQAAKTVGIPQPLLNYGEEKCIGLRGYGGVTR